MQGRYLGGAVCALFLLAGPLSACNVPVFRYALERWRPDPFHVVVFHRGALEGENLELVKLLERHGPFEDGTSNVDVHIVDLNKEPDPELVKLYEKHGKPELPRILVQTEDLDRELVTILSAPLTKDNVQALLDSPARREIARRILAGETAVWVLLECGDQAKDDAAAQLLERELKKLEGVLKLPEQTDDPEDRIAERGPPLKIAFSVLRLKADDPAEEILRTMFLKSEEDLDEFKTDPMTFPVFGRGRALPGLFAKGVTPENIAEWCTFLIGPCSCTIKFQNPGFDLLLTVDWESALEGILPEEPTIREGETVPLPSPPSPAASEEAPAAPVKPVVAPEPEQGQLQISRRQMLIGGIGLAGLLVLLTGVWALRSSMGAG